jgi:hypothetical protein
MGTSAHPACSSESRLYHLRARAEGEHINYLKGVLAAIPTARPYSPASLALDVRRFDDGAPFPDLGLVKGGKTHRGLLLARGDVQAKLSASGVHTRTGERLYHRGIEFGDDVGIQMASDPARPKPSGRNGRCAVFDVQMARLKP